MDKKTIGNFIAILRKAKGMTQRELAELLNVSDKAVSRWERDESTPDITLIPVLADIFDVSCDELLRGEKAGADRNEETTERKTYRIQVLLKRSKNRFWTFSMSAVAITVIGFVAALICNFIFHKATLGFYCALGCFACAEIVMIALYHFFRGEIDSEELQDEAIKQHRRYLREHTLKCTYVILIFLGICMPLLFLGQMDYAEYIAQLAGTEQADVPQGVMQVGLQPDTWVCYGGIGAGIAGIFCFGVDCLVNQFDQKRRRRLKYVLITVVILMVTIVIGGVFYKVMPKVILKGTSFETYEDFKEYMETIPGDMSSEIVELRTQLDRYKGTIYGEDEEVLCEYTIYNDDVVHIEYGHNDKLPITTYTEEDYAQAERRTQNMMWIFGVAGVMECVGVIGIFFNRKKEFENAS